MLNKKMNNNNEIKNNKKWEKIMKKIIIIVVTIMTMVMTLTGCSNPFRKDTKHATVSITTSDGQSYLMQSFNGSNATISGKELALKAKIIVNMETSETAHIIFKCEDCGNEQEFDIAQPWSDIISCDCPEKLDEEGNAKEYSAIVVTYDQEENEKEDKK